MKTTFLIASTLCMCMLAIVQADVCVKQSSSVSVYSSGDTSITTAAGFIAEFSVSCENWKSGSQPPLYWVMVSPSLPASDGKPLPAVRALENKYQVSWTEETPASGDRKVLIYTEEGYTALRKAIRSGEPVESVAPLMNIAIPYSTGYTGPTVSSEVLAALASVGVAYLAIKSKSKLVS